MGYYDCEELDELIEEAAKLVVNEGKASASIIQRRMKLGYARSARILDQLERCGVIRQANGAKPRDVLLGLEGLEKVKYLIPKKEPTTEYIEPEIDWNKTNYAAKSGSDLEIEIGADEKKKSVSFDFEKYNSLLIIGSQFTSVNKLMNNILALSMAKYCPKDLRIIAFDGTKGDLTVPTQPSHLLVPLIVEMDKMVSALKWAVSEVERRQKMKDYKNFPKIFIVIHSLNDMMTFSPGEVEEGLYRLMVQGRRYGIYFVISTDYLAHSTFKGIIANMAARLVFKSVNKKIARENGIPESVNLTSPDEAILETIYEGRKKITVNKMDVNKIYKEVFK